jgi:FKBP-type peptidyl-prolyl cis-trans isomerase
MTNLLKIFFCVGIVSVGMVSCLSNVELEDDKRKAENEQIIKQYLSANNLTGTRTNSGKYYSVTSANASGRTVSVSDSIFVTFKITSLDGKTVLNAANASTPYIYRYGYLSPVFNEVLNLIKEGEKAVVLIPGTQQGFDNLPAYTPYKCEITSYKLRTEDDRIEEYLKTNKLKVTEKTADGLRYIRLQDGTGDAIPNGKVVRVKYTGRFLTNIAFDGNFNKTDSLSVTIGAVDQLVAGFQRGVEKMKLGERAMFVFPSALGYTSKGSGSIAPFTPISFEVKILKIKP